MTDGKIRLLRRDAAALVVGRLILAWGEVDHMIEELTLYMWRALQAPAQLANGKIEPPPVESRASYRLKNFRRYFAKVSENDPAALAECDRTLNRLRALEPIRSAFAHGLPYVKGQDHDGAIEVRRYSADDTKPGARKAELTTYTLDEIDAAAREVREIAEWLGPFSQRYTAPFVLKTFASHNANSLAPTSPLNSGQSASSRSLSQAARYGSSISAIAITSGDKPLKK